MEEAEDKSEEWKSGGGGEAPSETDRIHAIVKRRIDEWIEKHGDGPWSFGVYMPKAQGEKVYVTCGEIPGIKKSRITIYKEWKEVPGVTHSLPSK